MCVVPVTQVNTCGVVNAAPSTVNETPGGSVVMVIPDTAEKFPVTDRDPLIVTETVRAVPVAPPLQFEKTYPVFGFAVSCTTVPLL